MDDSQGIGSLGIPFFDIAAKSQFEALLNIRNGIETLNNKLKESLKENKSLKSRVQVLNNEVERLKTVLKQSQELTTGACPLRIKEEEIDDENVIVITGELTNDEESTDVLAGNTFYCRNVSEGLRSSQVANPSTHHEHSLRYVYTDDTTQSARQMENVSPSLMEGISMSQVGVPLEPDEEECRQVELIHSEGGSYVQSHALEFSPRSRHGNTGDHVPMSDTLSGTKSHRTWKHHNRDLNHEQHVFLSKTSPRRSRLRRKAHRRLHCDEGVKVFNGMEARHHIADDESENCPSQVYTAVSHSSLQSAHTMDDYSSNGKDNDNGSPVNTLSGHVDPRGMKKYSKCDVCLKDFSSKANLNRHMKLHTGEKPFKCNLCGKKFRQKVTLTAHVRTHTGEKPYQCHLCENSYRHKNSLNAHIRMHTVERQPKCKVCGKVFQGRSALNDHMMKLHWENVV